MQFSRRHYEFLAYRIMTDGKLNKGQKQLMASVIGEWFRVVANFNRLRWYKACGVSEEDIKEVLDNDTGYTYEVPASGRTKTTKG